MNIAIPEDFTERQKPFFVSLEIWSHQELIGITSLGYHHVNLEESTGHYVIVGNDSRFAFTQEEIGRLQGDHLMIRYDIGYKLHFANFSHSSMT